MTGHSPRAKRRVDPPRRVYTERPPARKEVDLQQRMTAIGSVVIVGGIGGIFGAVSRAGFLPGLLVGAVVGYVLVRLLLAGASKFLVGWVLNPSGKSTARRRGFSLAESLAIRGQIEEAIAAYKAACAESPNDPEPYIRLARLYRDDLEQYEEAVAWFKRARSGAAVDKGCELLVTQEIIEIYTRQLDAPGRAIPELVSIVDRFAADPAAEWATRRLTELREAMRADDEERE